MASEYLHGIQILEVDSGGRIITTPSTSVIGLVGTAPGANANKYPINKPILVTNLQELKDLGEVGTVPMALRGIYNQASPICVVVRIEDGSDINGTIKNAAGDMVGYTGVYGSNVYQMLDMPINLAGASISAEVLGSINAFEPRVKVNTALVTRDNNGGMLVEILTENNTKIEGVL